MAGAPVEDLPDHVIGHIFSFLPTRDAIKTCFLGKSWRYYWTTIPALKFYVTSQYDSFVDLVLSRYKAQKMKVNVKKFHLDINSEVFCTATIYSWVAFAIDRQVEELLLDLNISLHCNCYGGHHGISGEDLTLSPLLYNCSSLTSLFLRGCIFPPCEGVSWSSLKSLSIGCVDGDVLQKILLGSPVLEYLTLQECRGVEEIRSMSLREFVIDGYVEESRLHISTPRLLSLRVSAYFIGKSIIRIVEAPSLLEAALDFDGLTESDFCRPKEMLRKLQNATRILFGPKCCRVMRLLKMEDIRDSLPNCKTLTFHLPILEFSFPAIANMLAATPNLEKLVISFVPSSSYSDFSDLDSDDANHKSYWHIKKEFICWGRHLRNLEIFGFFDCLRDRYKELLTLIRFLLRHAFVLQNMVIKVRDESRYLEVVSSDKVHEVTQRLKRYHKASDHASIILNYLDKEHRKRHKIFIIYGLVIRIL